tara:strand:- start:323 stop:475 length:153 start_codon:yes stop_codon:yes gene_type:complete
MTTLLNTTMENVIAKTSFNYNSLEADLLITGMSCGFSFIKAFKVAKQLSK